jgi:hypothetical protein
MKKLLPAALTVLLLSPTVGFAGPGHSGGGSHGGGSHGGGSRGGGSHGGGSHGGGSGGGGWHGGGGSHGGGSHGGSHGGGRHIGRGGRVIFGGPYWGGWGWGWGPDYYGDYGPAYGPAYDDDQDQEDQATVDLDVSPGEARVYLDGRYIGTADDFGGDPDSLTLRPGSYRLEFRLEGYESQSIDIDADPGATIEVHKNLRRTSGARRYRLREAPRPEDGVQPYSGRRQGTGRPDVGYGRPLRNGRERLLLSAHPDDAAVYLDDRFLGTAEQLGATDDGVPLTPGRHTITVSRPGFKSRTVEINVARGEAKKVDVSLDR